MNLDDRVSTLPSVMAAPWALANKHRHVNGFNIANQVPIILLSYNSYRTLYVSVKTIWEPELLFLWICHCILEMGEQTCAGWVTYIEGFKKKCNINA